MIHQFDPSNQVHHHQSYALTFYVYVSRRARIRILCSVCAALMHYRVYRIPLCLLIKAESNPHSLTRTVLALHNAHNTQKRITPDEMTELVAHIAHSLYKPPPKHKTHHTTSPTYSTYKLRAPHSKADLKSAPPGRLLYHPGRRSITHYNQPHDCKMSY